MKYRVISFLVLMSVFVHASSAVSGPILKPRKYHGPIPRGTFILRVGFLGGPENKEMNRYLDNRFPKVADADIFSEDFGNALLVEGAYTYKIHPQVAVRANISASFLKSNGVAEYVPDLQGVQKPEVRANRDFDVDLFVAEGSALYFFTDAAINEFQPYSGAGFSLGVPHATFKETHVVTSPTSVDFTQGEVFALTDRDQWSTEAGVHAIIGAMYYVGNKFSFNVEGRYHFLQSKFPLTVKNNKGADEDVKFDVDFSGFMLNIGTAYSF